MIRALIPRRAIALGSSATRVAQVRTHGLRDVSLPRIGFASSDVLTPFPGASLTGLRSFSSGGSVGDSLQEVVGSADVVVISSPTCPFCRAAIDALQAENVQHTVVEITAGLRDGLKAKVGKTSVPSVWVKGVYVGGCNDGLEPWHGVMPMLRSGKLKEMLAAP
eukprot:TRINITY_DN2356_c0_g1_i2.p1 TRINITY_DN2356_c0_g1~~TRINITY_DN2356_c0_g1_i2.p1  ORF type:complete len:164 (+),score=26.82 TRINITY_DN2356_c0_g1_i2:74-565(+)